MREIESEVRLMRAKVCNDQQRVQSTGDACDVCETNENTARNLKPQGRRRPRAQCASEWTPTPLQCQVWRVLRTLSPGFAFTGPVLVEELKELEVPVITTANVIRTHVMPDLKRFAGVRNQRRIGYYIEASLSDAVAVEKLDARLIKTDLSW